jgi:mannonate dehydratase
MYSMKQTMRWLGPDDPVSLADIKQAGCSGVVTSLHHIPIGKAWPAAEILKRKKLIEEAGLSWDVAENLPVHENIKTQSRDFETCIENFRKTLVNLANCGIRIVTYNFSPLFNWIRTDFNFNLADGSATSKFDRSALIAFDSFILKHHGAERLYSKEDFKKAEHLFQLMNEEEKDQLQMNILSGMTFGTEDLSLDELRAIIGHYKKMNVHKYRQFLYFFLSEILPVADEHNLQLAIHPDDPPYPVFGLPRIASTAAELSLLFEAAPSLNNGLCFCTSTLGARKNNDLPAIAREFYDRIHYLQLGNIQRHNRDFWEADHLQGSIDIYAVLRQIILIMQKRGVSIPMRCDRDLQFQVAGYSAINRFRGLGELRGLEMGIQRMLLD